MSSSATRKRKIVKGIPSLSCCIQSIGRALLLLRRMVGYLR
ncbi:hypothetical protein OTSANNIE_1166 [Anaplasma phagocytophilum str. Annie]|nr:hypothetical protein APHWEB_1119 [Anaplasma phagocytophilum str. Webster]KJV98285.1 hypothetical protein OTSANNIE_1166 [Anaplasma phagocytophilum str. Annie]